MRHTWRERGVRDGPPQEGVLPAIPEDDWERPGVGGGTAGEGGWRTAWRPGSAGWRGRAGGGVAGWGDAPRGGRGEDAAPQQRLPAATGGLSRRASLRLSYHKKRAVMGHWFQLDDQTSAESSGRCAMNASGRARVHLLSFIPRSWDRCSEICKLLGPGGVRLWHRLARHTPACKACTRMCARTYTRWAQASSPGPATCTHVRHVHVCACMYNQCAQISPGPRPWHEPDQMTRTRSCEMTGVEGNGS